MIRSAVGLACLLLTACVSVESTTRTERGPLLRTFERPAVLEGGFSAEAAVEWPKLNLAITAFDVCRKETVEEYAEERITEKSSRSAIGALVTGVASTLASAVLLGTSFIFADAPDVSVIDAAGRYGPSIRSRLQGFSLISGVIGLPALVVGLIGMARSGVETETMKVEQVASQRDANCNQRGVDGALLILPTQGAPVGPRAVKAGQVHLELADALRGVETLTLDGRAVTLDETSTRTVDAFVACAQLGEPFDTLEPIADATLLSRAQGLRTCRDVHVEVAAELARLEAELAKRREAGRVSAFSPGAMAESFDAAVASNPPKHRLDAQSPELTLLSQPDALNGQSVVMVGIVEGALASNIGVLQLGDQRVFLFMPPQRAWGGDFGPGARVEVLAVMAGVQTVGSRTLPLARAVWMRNAF